jgi:hypothetical protein
MHLINLETRKIGEQEDYRAPDRDLEQIDTPVNCAGNRTATNSRRPLPVPAEQTYIEIAFLLRIPIDLRAIILLSCED